MNEPRFIPGQPVTLHFSPAGAAAYTVEAVIVENCDAVCAPLTDVWTVDAKFEGRTARFGFSGRHIAAR